MWKFSLASLLLLFHSHSLYRRHSFLSWNATWPFAVLHQRDVPTSGYLGQTKDTLGASPDCALVWSWAAPRGVSPVNAGCGDSFSVVWEVTARVMAGTQGSTVLPQQGQNSVPVVPVGNLEKASPKSTSIAFKTQSFVGTEPRIFQELYVMLECWSLERKGSECVWVHAEREISASAVLLSSVCQAPAPEAPWLPQTCCLRRV